jgi:OmpA-OmpF porin, OOP family
MRLLFTLVITVLFLLPSLAQEKLSGTWLGVLQRAGQSYNEGTPFYLIIEGEEKSISGYTREEIYDTDDFAVKQIRGTAENGTLNFQQIVISKSKRNPKIKWCRFDAKLKYNSTTGYLEGEFESTGCKRLIGKITLYRSSYNFAQEEKNELSQLWFSQIVKDLQDGLFAPEIRKKERDNFKFEPVFFDFDKAEIRSEHYDFLNRLIMVVKGHSDLRVKVIGHTDADGSDTYNDDLSKRRAEVIIKYFAQHGLSSDRLEFDFKGEKQPVDSNNTPEGKQRNRRVDFKFI